MAFRITPSSLRTPTNQTSCPACLKVETTSYSVRQGCLSLSSTPSRVSGGINSLCSNTTMRSFFWRLPFIEQSDDSPSELLALPEPSAVPAASALYVLRSDSDAA